MEFPNVFQIFLDGDEDCKDAFVYKLKQPCDTLNVIISDKGNCWDVITYNRFFYDREEEFCKEDELLIR